MVLARCRDASGCVTASLHASANAQSWMCEVGYAESLHNHNINRLYYRDIYSKRALLRWAQTCTYSVYQSIGSELKATPEQIITHLENVIEMLGAYPNYQIALMDDDTKPNGDRLPDPLWLVAGDREHPAVFMEIWKQEDRIWRNDINVQIKEARIVRAFERHFDRLWDLHALPNADDNRAAVITWFRGLIASIKDSQIRPQ